MPLDFSSKRTDSFEQRLFVCSAVVIAFFLIVFLRLFYMQIIEGKQFFAFSMEHTMKEIRLPASRGVIFDRNRIKMVDNRPSFDLLIVPQHVKNIEGLKKALFEIASIDPEKVEARWKAARHAAPFLPQVIATDVSYDQAVRLRVAKAVESDDLDPVGLRGVEIIARTLRDYPQGPIATNTVGYIGEVSEKDLPKLQKTEPGRYFSGDLMGASGLERYWEHYLKGKDGYELRIVDAVGRQIISEEFSSFQHQEDSTPGDNLILTIDSRLQKFAEERFEGKSGALVAIDPRNGEILAMVSLPAYDPVRLVSNVSPAYWTALIADPKKLLLNRAIQGVYPPGSTYKVVTAIAGLEEKAIKPDETMHCGGGLQFGGRLFKCWNHNGHGAITVRRAIPESCDTFFYTTGLRLGPDKLAKYANMLGLGHKTGIDLDGEKAGTIPTAEWKKRLFGQDWQPGESLSIGVGQGYDTVTPLQNALMVARVATGKDIHPHLLKSIQDPEGKTIREEEEKVFDPLPISKETLDLVHAAMLETTESPAGTAHRSQSKYVKIAGKTGTAQVISEEMKSKARGMNTGDHAWFVSYAPADDPRIAVAVIVEHGGFGATSAAPIAKDVIEKYLELQGIIKLPPKEQKEQNVR
jgi:penicillin-binding protein 2